MQMDGSINYLREVIEHFHSNIIRIGRLTRLPRLPDPDSKMLKEMIDEKELEKLGEILASMNEVLRAAVVLSHASFEDALREIARLKLHESPEKILDEISLAGISLAGQSKKFSLKELSSHRGKTVDEVMQESINEFLDGKSFSNTKQVANMLEKMEIDLERVNKYFRDLDQMMKRRHQIVHKADMTGSPGSRRVTHMDPEDVARWVTTVSRFIMDVAFLVMPSEIREKIIALPEFRELQKLI